MIPGRALHRFAELLLPPHVCDQIVDAQLADFQHEWASAKSGPGRMLILIRGYLAFCMVFITCAVGMRGLAADDRQALRRVFMIALAATFLTMIGLPMVLMGNVPFPAHPDGARLLELQRFRRVLYLNAASQLLPLGVGVGFVCGIAMGLPREASAAARRAVSVTLIAATVAVFALSSWFLPVGFRALSQVIRGQASTGLPAATTLADARRAMMAVQSSKTAGPGSIRGATAVYFQRWSWPCSTFVLGLFALSLAHRGRAVRMIVGLAGCIVYFYLVRDLTQALVWQSALAPAMLAWTPNLLFLAAGVLVRAFRFSSESSVVTS
jgi:hypothetical protein